MKKYLELFWTFFKIGAFTFGGGYAMIPMIQKETVQRQHWIEEKDILDIMAIAESTPGPIAINAATFVGYHTAGVMGAFCATFGVVLPSFLIILGIASFLRQFESLKVVKYAFDGIRVGVTALIINALISMWKQCDHHYLSLAIIGFAFLTTLFSTISPLIIIIACAVIGLVGSWIQERREKKS